MIFLLIFLFYKNQIFAFCTKDDCILKDVNHFTVQKKVPLPFNDNFLEREAEGNKKLLQSLEKLPSKFSLILTIARKHTMKMLESK